MQTLNLSEQPSSTEIAAAADLTQLVLAVRERYWVVLVCAFAGVLTAGIYLKHLPVRFESKCVLQPEQRGRVLGFESEGGQVSGAGEGGLQTVLEAFRSRTLLQRVVRNLRLTEDVEFSAVPLSMESALAAVGEAVEVRQRKGAQLIDVIAQHASPGIAQKLADGVAMAFMQSQLDQRSAGSRSVVEFLMAEAERLKSRLQKSEEALQNYKESTQASSLEDRQDTVITALKVQGNNFEEARSARIRLESDLAEMERFAGQPTDLLRIGSVMQHPAIAATRTQIADLQSKLSVLRLRYTEKHPRMIQAQAQLRDAESALRQAVLQVPATLRADLERAAATERNFEVALKEHEKQALALNRQSISYKVLARDVETDRALYESILRKLKETDVARGVQSSDFRVFEAAQLPLASKVPPTWKLLAFGLFAGAAVGGAVVLGECLLSGAWRSAEEIEAGTGYPVLATVPKMSRGVGGTLLEALNDPKQPAMEAFRSLRTVLHLGERKQGKNCFLFTSAAPEDGKSFCAVGYASTLARQGVKTVLIDADLRAPSLEKTLLGTAVRHGLVDILDGTHSLSDSVVRTSVPLLDLLPAGKVLPNASELLTRKGIQAILRELGQSYECLVVDSAPVQLVSDTLLLAEAVDAICFVVRHGKTPRKEAQRALQLFREHGTPVAGVVFNGAKVLPGYGYYGRAEV
jgi:succinoglycan biosynthesis transport protein ExoP